MSLLLKIRQKIQTAFKLFSLSQNQFLLMITPGWLIILKNNIPLFPNLILTKYENKQWNSARNIKSLSSAFLLTIKQRIKRGTTVRIESIINFSHLFMWKMATSKTCNVQSNSEFLSYAISKIGLTGTTAIHQAHGEAQCGGSIQIRISNYYM